MLWLVIMMALAIPLAVVVLDSPPMRAIAERKRQEREGHAPSGELAQLAEKVETLEAELETVNRDLAHLKESQQFLQQMLENPEKRDQAKLPKPPA